jgi:NTE family protein
MSADGSWNTTAAGNVIHEADVVFEGGGVKGIALAAGAAQFEERGFTKWKSLAGTSAGAIMAAYVACGHSAADALELVQNLDWKQFEDWGRLGEVAGGAINLERIHGVCHGDVFHTWMTEQVHNKTFGDVWDDATNTSRLRMIATDITRHKMLVLPDDLSDYQGTDGKPFDPKAFPIAEAVRMSMAIPYFFAPWHLVAVGDDSAPRGTTCTIVDGGVLSNFPIWLFDSKPDADPTRPTFGFFITGGRGVGGGLEWVGKLNWALGMGLDIFHTTTGAWDARFHSHSTIVRTCAVPVDGLGTTDFARAKALAPRIIADARKAADAFLDSFVLADYRNGAGNRIA